MNSNIPNIWFYNGFRYTIRESNTINKQGQEWKESDSYGQDDLLALAKLLDLAHTWILMEQQNRSQQRAA